MWYGSCTVQDRKDLAPVVKTAPGFVGRPFLHLASIYTSWVPTRVCHIAADPTHPGHKLLVPLPSVKTYRNIITHTNRLKHSFFPRAVKSITPSPHKHPHPHPQLHCTLLFCFISFCSARRGGQDTLLGCLADSSLVRAPPW